MPAALVAAIRTASPQSSSNPTVAALREIKTKAPGAIFVR
jgi:hypothetical protein